jgi:thioredoxin-like negative regulator of GroEL
MPKSVDLGTKRPEEVKEVLGSDKPILMLYRMQMCPHCIALQPTWADVKRRLGRDKGLLVAEVEYQHMSLLPSALRNIRGFPTIQVVQKGRVRDEYNGDRSTDSIVAFARAFATPEPPKAAKGRTAAATKRKTAAQQ